MLALLSFIEVEREMAIWQNWDSSSVQHTQKRTWPNITPLGKHTKNSDASLWAWQTQPKSLSLPGVLVAARGRDSSALPGKSSSSAGWFSNMSSANSVGRNGGPSRGKWEPDNSNINFCSPVYHIKMLKRWVTSQVPNCRPCSYFASRL